MPSRPADALARIAALYESAAGKCDAALELAASGAPAVQFAVLADALRELRQGLDEARATAQVVGAAWDDGHEAGRKAGYEQALAEMTPQRRLRSVG